MSSIPAYNICQNARNLTITERLLTDLEAIRDSIAEGKYKTGTWQQMLTDLIAQDRATRRALKSVISNVSDALHKRHGYRCFDFMPAYLIELSLIAAAILLSSASSLPLSLLATFLFAVTLPTGPHSHGRINPRHPVQLRLSLVP